MVPPVGEVNVPGLLHRGVAGAPHTPALNGR